MQGRQLLVAAGFAASVFLVAQPGAAFAQPGQQGPVKVVYHVNEGDKQALNALRNIRNHLAADASAKIIVVAHADGIRFLLDGAMDSNKAPFDATVQELKDKGVEFRVCKFTLDRLKIEPSKLIPEATLVPSGVAEVSRLQFREGFSYLKP